MFRPPTCPGNRNRYRRSATIPLYSGRLSFPLFHPVHGHLLDFLHTAQAVDGTRN